MKRNIKNNIEKEGGYANYDYIKNETDKIETMSKIINSNDDVDRKREKALQLISNDEYKKSMEKDMDNELEILLKKYLQHLSPKK